MEKRLISKYERHLLGIDPGQGVEETLYASKAPFETNQCKWG